jgi:hypothetical protein
MKTKAQHTPGPWNIDRINDGIYHVNSEPPNAGWGAICEVRANGLGSRHILEPEAGFNASLIAAAPDLLEALKGITENEHFCTCGDLCDGKCWHSIAVRAIAKAEGK